jgi:uncharacterized coiled-coil DUF342 family protein
MKEHFYLEEHQSNRNVYCAYCDKKFKGTRAGELTEHRSELNEHRSELSEHMSELTEHRSELTALNIGLNLLNKPV